MTESSSLNLKGNELSANEVQGLEYVVIGVATCFQKDDEGRLQEVLVAEPIPATDLDCLAQGIRTTSYQMLYAATYAEVVQQEQPALPSDIFLTAVPGSDFVFRTQAATRTYRAKPEFRHIPLHEICTPEKGVFRLKYSPEPRRIINALEKVSDTDNIKQHSHTHTVL
jgi:hypothetical protein